MSDLPMRQLAAEDHAREALSAAAPGAALFLACRDGEVGRKSPTARCASSRSSMSSATARRRSCSATSGETIKRHLQASRKEIGGILEQPVHLFLFVKVRENWGDDPERALFPARWASTSPAIGMAAADGAAMSSMAMANRGCSPAISRPNAMRAATTRAAPVHIAAETAAMIEPRVPRRWIVRHFTSE
jgi:hypothetical protein